MTTRIGSSTFRLILLWTRKMLLIIFAMTFLALLIGSTFVIGWMILVNTFLNLG